MDGSIHLWHSSNEKKTQQPNKILQDWLYRIHSIFHRKIMTVLIANKNKYVNCNVMGISKCASRNVLPNWPNLTRSTKYPANYSVKLEYRISSRTVHYVQTLFVRFVADLLCTLSVNRQPIKLDQIQSNRWTNLWSRQDLLRRGAKLEIRSWSTYGGLRSQVQQLLDD